MSGKPKPKDADVLALETVSKMAREQADMELATMKNNMNAVHNVGLISGRAQAFRAMRLIAEFLEYKQIAQLIDNEEHLKISGVTSTDDYLEQLGLGRSTAYNNLKIARTLTAEEVQLLGQVGFTRRDLLSYASLPDEKRLEIREGKVINLESASREEIKDLIEQVIVEKATAVEDAQATVKAKDRRLEDKEKEIQKLHKELTKLEDRAAAREMTAEEDAFLQKMKNLRMGFDGYMLKADPDAAMSGLADITPRMRAALISNLQYIRMQALAAYDTAVMTYGNPTINPEVAAECEAFEQEYEAWAKQQASEA